MPGPLTGRAICFCGPEWQPVCPLVAPGCPRRDRLTVCFAGAPARRRNPCADRDSPRLNYGLERPQMQVGKSNKLESVPIYWRTGSRRAPPTTSLTPTERSAVVPIWDNSKIVPCMHLRQMGRQKTARFSPRWGIAPGNGVARGRPWKPAHGRQGVTMQPWRPRHQQVAVLPLAITGQRSRGRRFCGLIFRKCLHGR